MPFRPVIASLLLLSSMAYPAEAARLNTDEHFQKGYQAMEDGLHGVALAHFAKVPAAALSDNEEKTFALLLAEVEIRNGLPENLENAHRRLQTEMLQGNERATYWKARAFLVQEKYALALAELSLLEKASEETIRHAALRTRLNLYLAQKKYADGLALIDAHLARDANQPDLLLEKAKFHLAAGQLPEVEAILGLRPIETESETEDEAKTLTEVENQQGRAWDFLRAQFFLQKKDRVSGQRAAENFARVLATETDQASQKTPAPLLNPALKERALIGLGRALVQADESVKAADHFLDAIETRPNAELTKKLFNELAAFIPENGQGSEVANLLKKRLKNWLKVSDGTPVSPTPIGSADPRRLYAAYLYGQLLAQESRQIVVQAAGLAQAETPDDSAQKKAELQEQAISFFRLVMSGEQADSLPVAQKATYEWARLLSEIPATRARGVEQLKSLAMLETISLPVRTAAYHQLGLLLSDDGSAPEALSYFNKASQLTASEESAYNAALLALNQTDDAALPSFRASQQKVESLALLENLHYAEAIYYVRSNNDEKAIKLLEALLAQEAEKANAVPPLPAFPQLAEARLTLAELILKSSQGQSDKVAALLKEADPTKLPTPQLLRFAMTHLRLQQQQGGAITQIAFEGLELPQESADLLRLKTAEAFYLNEEYNKAQRLFLDLAETLTDESGKRSARFFAAQSAMKVGTPKSREEGLALFQELISKSKFSSDRVTCRACLASAQYYLNLGQAKAALTVLEKIPSPQIDPAEGRLPADQLSHQLLLARTHQALGGNDPEHYAKALRIYENLTQQSDLSASWQARLAYRQGLCHEGLDQANEALALYHSVIRQDETRVLTAEDWKWYYRNGFRAVSLLEEQKNWAAAHAIAQRLATHQDAKNQLGPRAEEAKKRAQALKESHGL